MKNSKEQEILNYMTKLKITREEAEELWNDDNSNKVRDDVKQLEAKSKASDTKRRYEQSAKTRKTSTKERKVDEIKKQLLTNVRILLEGMKAEIKEVKTETEITFAFEDAEYSFKLTKHRTKQKLRKLLSKKQELFINKSQ